MARCDFDDLKQDANMSFGYIKDCSTGQLGIKGEQCGMGCDLGSHLSAPAFAECVEDYDGTTRWDWKLEGNETSNIAPFCEREYQPFANPLYTGNL